MGNIIGIVVAMLCCLLALPTSTYAKTEIWLPGTFSNLRSNTEAGDLRGVELKIVATLNGHQGALQIAEGSPSEIMVVGSRYGRTTPSISASPPAILFTAAGHSRERSIRRASRGASHSSE